VFAQLNLPRPAHLARHAAPRLLEGTVIPLALFYGGLEILGLAGALAASLLWCLAALAWRVATKRPVSALLLLSAAGLVARSALALATGSVFIYFLQPSLGTLLVGFVFLASVPMGGRTLAERLADDFVPLPDHVITNPAIRRIFRRISLLWGVVNIVNAGITLWLLVSQSLGIYLLLRPLVTWAGVGLGVAVSALWFRRALRHVPVPAAG
jgi:intracellular septation protein A